MPPVTIVTVLTETVQTAGVFETNFTGRFELAVAVSVNGAAPKFTLLRGRNVMVCADSTVIVIVLLVEAVLTASPAYAEDKVWTPAARPAAVNV